MNVSNTWKGFRELKVIQYINSYEIIWRNVAIFLIFHLAAIYGLWLMLTQASWKTAVYTYLYSTVSLIGITAGAHRLWAHRTYKAKLPLRIILMIMQSACMQNSIFTWARRHRLHHKFSDTNADPHNAARGFFFSHIGWLLAKKHEDVYRKGKEFDLSDLTSDPVVMFQKKYFWTLSPLLCFYIPPLVPWYFWNESLWNSVFITAIFRYILSLNLTCLVNSAAHLYGNKPYDKNIYPNENRFVAFLAYGEGWHNYHHVFPWDYKAAELGNYSLNVTTALLDFMAKIGWAYDLRTVSPEMLKKRIEKTGDGSWQKVE